MHETKCRSAGCSRNPDKSKREHYVNRIDVNKAVRQLSDGEMIILADGDGYEKGGDMLVLADKICSRHLDFMTCYACGPVYVPISGKIADQFQLVPVVQRKVNAYETALVISVDAANIGIDGSTENLVETVRRLVDPYCVPEALSRPGNVYLLVAKDGGPGEQGGRTEASVELARLCKAAEAGVVCRIKCMESGTKKGKELEIFAVKHGLGILSVDEFKEYLKTNTMSCSPHIKIKNYCKNKDSNVT